jgi:hypothetical protein
LVTVLPPVPNLGRPLLPCRGATRANLNTRQAMASLLRLFSDFFRHGGVVQLRIPRLPLYLPRRPFATMLRCDWSRCLFVTHRRRGSQHHRPSFTLLSFVTLSLMSYVVPTHRDSVGSFPFGNYTTMIATQFCTLRRCLSPCPVSSSKTTARFLPA